MMSGLLALLVATLVSMGMALMVRLVVNNKMNILLKRVLKIVRPPTYLCSKHAGKQPKGLALVCEKRCIMCKLGIK